MNYDGLGGRFGDTSVAAATSNHEATSVYASVDEGRDDRLVIVAINKSTGATNAEVAIRHPRALASGRSFQITSAASALVGGPAVSPAAPNLFRIRLPAQSVTTIVLGP